MAPALAGWMIGALLIGGAAGGCGSVHPEASSNSSAAGGAVVSGPAAVQVRPTSNETRGLSEPADVNSVKARCPVPAGWEQQPLKEGPNNKHQVWISPSRRTAYGVLFVSLPFPAGLVPASFRMEKSLEGFLREMKKREGRADLIERHDDAALPGIHFVAEGGRYEVRANLAVHGVNAWFVYAGTLQNQPRDPEELDVGERARDQTTFIVH